MDTFEYMIREQSVGNITQTKPFISMKKIRVTRSFWMAIANLNNTGAQQHETNGNDFTAHQGYP